MYLSVEDIAELFGLSVSFAYRVVERMNADLASCLAENRLLK